jgi:membrane protein involved in colicin uptake
MKYAIIGPRGRINRVTEGEPRYKAENATVVQISDEQAAVVEAGRSSVPPVMYGYKKDKLVNFKEFMEERMAKRKAEQEAKQKARKAERDAEQKAKQEARKAERKAQREAGAGNNPQP